VGESVTVEGVTVTVLEATDQGDTVQVTVVK
jgi:riboflavin synthase alpha subunit